MFSMNFLNKLLAINLNYEVLTRVRHKVFSISLLWWLDELEVLIRCKESNEHWHLDDLNLSDLVHIEVSPGLVEVGVEVFLESLTRELLVGGENLLGGGVGSGLGHPESSGWGTSWVGGGLWGLGLNSVVLDHGSHEDIIIITSESWGGNSLVGLGSDHARVSWNENVSANHEVGLVIGGGG